MSRAIGKSYKPNATVSVLKGLIEARIFCFREDDEALELRPPRRLRQTEGPVPQPISKK